MEYSDRVQSLLETLPYGLAIDLTVTCYDAKMLYGCSFDPKYYANPFISDVEKFLQIVEKIIAHKNNWTNFEISISEKRESIYKTDLKNFVDIKHYLPKQL